MNNDKLLSQLLRFYVILFPIKILNLPYIGDKLQKLQPADMLFLIILAASIFQLPKLKLISLRNFDKAILFWLFAHLTTCLFHPTRPALIECIGTIYLVLLYVVINITFASKTKDEIREWLFKSVELSAFCLMFFGLLGIFLALLGYPSMLSGKWGNFPYFGTIYRMLGLTAQPIMFASIGGISLLILITAFNSKKYTEMSSFSKTTLLLLGLGLPLTFAKSLVISYFCSAALVLDSYSKKYRKYIPFVFALALGFYIFAAHFVFVNKNVFDNQKNLLFNFLDQSAPMSSVGDKYIIKTGYALLKEKGWSVFTQNPLVGIGAGNLNTEPFKTDNSNYAIIAGYDPHSSYTGILSEMGILGFLAFIGLFLTALGTINRLLKINLTDPDRLFLHGFLAIFIFMACEGIATDVMNFRVYWIIFAFFAAWSRKFSLSLNP